MSGAKRQELLLTLCFLFSGAAGLMYEVVWSRSFSLFIGITTYAHTAVIAAYMLGLALGSYCFGRWSDRHASPLRLYALMELTIAVYAAATPWLAGLIQQLYAPLAAGVGITGLPSHLLRFAMVLLLLLPPTFLMGGTLPVMVRAMTRELSGLIHSTGRLYGINTLGAVAGALAAGYFLIPAIGMRNTIWFGSALDVMVAAAVFGLSGNAVRSDADAAARETRREPPVFFPGLKCIPWLFAFSGFAAMTYQIAWIRALTLVVGSSVYSFTTTVATFLAGIGLGSIAYRRFPGGKTEAGRLHQAGFITSATGLSAIAGLLLIHRLPGWFLWGFQQGAGEVFGFFQLYVTVLCMTVMLVPTFLLGAMFPLMAALWSRRAETVGRDVGVIYAANTIGCIAGVLSSGLLFLPLLGVRGTILAAALIHTFAGAAFFLQAGRLCRKNQVHLVGGAVVMYAAMALVAPSWNKFLMTSGVYVYAPKMMDVAPGEALAQRMKSVRLLYYKDGLDGTVSVIEDARQRMLAINGKIDASSLGDLPTQVMLGQFPVIMHPDARRVLVIGLGSGITAGSISLHKGIEVLDILEISPEVVEASKYFNADNFRVLSDPRVNVIVADARNFLLGTTNRYDIIVAQPSNPWISGISNLFTDEFFSLLAKRLNPGGVVSQWFQIYNMSQADTQSILHTYRQSFPFVSAWLSLSSDLIMIGSPAPHDLDAGHFLDLLRLPAFAEQMRFLETASFIQLTQLFLSGGDALAGYCHGASLNTDDRPLIEFHAPRYLYRATEVQTLAGIIRHARAYPSEPPVRAFVRETPAGLSIPALGISLESGNDGPLKSWSSGFRVGLDLIPEKENGVQALARGSQAWVEWCDQAASNQLTAIHVDHALANKDLLQFLVSDTNAIPISSGEVDIPGGHRGVWHLSKGKDAAEILLDVAWIAPAMGGGFHQFVATRHLPHLHRDVMGAVLVEFVKMLRPLTY